MRTTPTRARAVAAALRAKTAIRPAGAVTAVLAAALVAGVATTATASAQPTHAAARPSFGKPAYSLIDDSGTTTWTRTSGNQVRTPHFEYALSPWVGSGLTRERLGNRAPDGNVVARVDNRNNRVGADDWPGEVHTWAGRRYRGSLTVAAANWQSHLQPLTFVIREHTPGGTWVASRSVTIHLTYTFRQLIVDLVAKNSGDVVDIYASQGGTLLPKSAFFMDDAYIWGARPVSDSTPPGNNPPPDNTAPSTLGLLAYATGQPTDLGDTSKYAYVVVQENQFSHIAEIKRMNPHTKVLAYMNTSADSRTNCSTGSDDPHVWGASFGTNYCYAAKHHPEWFLRNHSGGLMHFVDYSFATVLDPGNAAWAESWASSVYANAKHDGFDGIWIDDVNVDPGHGLNNQAAKYSDEQYATATAQWGSRVGDYLRSHGMTVIANVGMQPWITYRLDATLAMAKHLTAVNREHFARYGDICGPFGERFNTTATNGTPPLSRFLDYASRLQAQGTKFTGVDYGYSTSTADDVATMTYGRALFLLSWNGTAGSAYFFRKCGVNDTAAAQWTASLGLPTGPIQTVDGGILVRNFQHGTVVLNPNRGGSSAHVTVHGGLHTMSGASADGGVYVAPQTAAILSS